MPATTSVAVLYFDNVSPDSADAYIAAGLTEELIARLGQIDRLQVKSRTAVQRYRGHAADDPAVLGRALGVANLVSGSVRRGGDRLRVTVELTRASTGVHVWGDTYERGAADLMGVEADIAQAIAAGVGGRLAPAERQSLAARPTVNPEAYDHYLRGNFLLARRDPASVQRGIGEYETALRLDSTFARAAARIAVAYGLFYDWSWTWPGLSPAAIVARTTAAAAKALRLDSSSADAWMAIAMARQLSNPSTLAGVEDAQARALALDPRNPEVWHHRGYTLAVLGRDSSADAAFEHALSLEPERVVTVYDLAYQRNLEGHPAEAARFIDSAATLDPESYYVLTFRAQLALNRGDTAAARRDAAAALRTLPAGYEMSIAPVLAALEARSGDSAAARRRMRALVGPSTSVPRSYSEGYFLAAGLVQIGDTGGALDILEHVVPRGLMLGYWIRDPVLDPLRSDSRFQRLVEETRPRR